MDTNRRRVADYFLCVGLPHHNPQPLEGRWTGGATWSGAEGNSGESSPAASRRPGSPPPSPGLSRPAREPITDVCVIFPTQGESPPPGFEMLLRTPTGLPADLNHGSLRSPEVFLCSKRGRDKAPLTDIGVLYEGREHLLAGCEVIEKTPYGLSANVNNTNSPRIFITYRRALSDASPDSLFVTDICIVIKHESPPHAYCKIDRNLNKGSLMGSDVFLCYKKSMSKDCVLLYKPEVLSRYPLVDRSDNTVHLPSVAKFGLPMGAALESWPVGCNRPKPVFSTFVLTQEMGEQIYGASVIFYEKYPESSLTRQQRRDLNLPLDLSTPPATPSTSRSSSDSPQGQGKAAENDRVGSSSSAYILKRRQRTVHASKAILVVSRWPFFDAFKRFLQFLYKTSLHPTGGHLPMERYIAHFLTDVPFPTTQRPRIVVQLSEEQLHLSLPEDSPLPRSGASFTLLLKNLGPEICVNLMTYTLMEHKLLVHSLRAVVLTSVIEALRSLLFPFRWQCPYIPLCPMDLADVLTAPLPFIVGVDSRYFDLYEPPTDVTWVDLDTRTITQPDDKKGVSYKLLPKRPAQVLKSTLEKLLLRAHEEQQMSRTAGGSAGEDGLSINLRQEQREAALGTAIQEAFLRFTASIMKGYKGYLKPITSQPDDSATSAKVLFDMEGFLRSRGRTYHRFYEMLMQTQLFIRFVEVRSFHSSQDAGLSFFDDCVDKVDENLDTPRLLGDLEESNRNERTVFVVPPEPTGLPEGATYAYQGMFPTLDPSLYNASDSSGRRGSEEDTGSVAPPGGEERAPRSHLARRTKAETRNSQKAASRAKSGVISLWAKAIVSSTFGLWFTQLPAFVQYAGPSHYSALKNALTVIRRMHAYRLHNPDETCYRVFMQLCGLREEPALAVNLLNEMKQYGVQPDALTYGYYNKAVLESKWTNAAEEVTDHAGEIPGETPGCEPDLLSGDSGTAADTSVGRTQHVTVRTTSSSPAALSSGETRMDEKEGEEPGHILTDKGYSSMGTEEEKATTGVAAADAHPGASDAAPSRLVRASKSLSNTPLKPRRAGASAWHRRFNTGTPVALDSKLNPERRGEGEKFRAQVGSIIRKSVGNLADLGSQFGSSAGLLMSTEESPYNSGWDLTPSVPPIDLGGSLNITSSATNQRGGSFSEQGSWQIQRRRHRSAGDALLAKKVAAAANQRAGGLRGAFLSPRGKLNSHGGESCTSRGEALETIASAIEDEDSADYLSLNAFKDLDGEDVFGTVDGIADLSTGVSTTDNVFTTPSAVDELASFLSAPVCSGDDSVLNSCGFGDECTNDVAGSLSQSLSHTGDSASPLTDRFSDPSTDQAGDTTLVDISSLPIDSTATDSQSAIGNPLELSSLHTVPGQTTPSSNSSSVYTPITTDDPLGALSASAPMTTSTSSSGATASSFSNNAVASDLAKTSPTAATASPFHRSLEKEGFSSSVMTPSKIASLPRADMSIEGLFTEERMAVALEEEGGHKRAGKTAHDQDNTSDDISPPVSPRPTTRFVGVGMGGGGGMTNGRLSKSQSIDSRLSVVSAGSEGSTSGVSLDPGAGATTPVSGKGKMGYMRNFISTPFSKRTATAATAGAVRLTKDIGSRLKTAMSKSRESITTATGATAAGDGASFSSRESLSNVGAAVATADHAYSGPSGRGGKSSSLGRSHRSGGSDGSGKASVTRTTSAYIGKSFKSATSSMATSLYRRYTEIKHQVNEFQSPSTIAPTPGSSAGGTTPGGGPGGHRRTGSGVSAGKMYDNISIRSGGGGGGGDDISIASSVDEYRYALDGKPIDMVTAMSFGSISSSFMDQYFPFRADGDATDGLGGKGAGDGPAQLPLYEVTVCSATPCPTCSSVLYEEEIMAGWSAEDSNLNTLCRYCSANVVPFLHITVQDLRKDKQKDLNTFSMNHDSSPSNKPRRKALTSSSSDTGTGDITSSVLDSDDLLLDDVGVLTSPPPSPHKKHFSKCDDPIRVPYLSALVLRKELENVLDVEGDEALSGPLFIDEHSFLFWNLVWYFKHLGLVSHLPNLILESCLRVSPPHSPPTEGSPTSLRPEASQVLITGRWDRPELQERLGKPLYVLWAQEDEPSPMVNALLTETKGLSRGHIAQILTAIECNDMSTPLRILLAERKRLAATSSGSHHQGALGVTEPGSKGQDVGPRGQDVGSKGQDVGSKGHVRRRYRSMYRELLFLTLAYFGPELMDHDAFDREFKLAFQRLALSGEDNSLLQRDDFPPTPSVIWCRKLFGDLSLPIPA